MVRAFGLLLAIPFGFLYRCYPIEYVRDYAAYLKLAQNLYSSGDYSDVSDGNESDAPDVLAWRPPGVALLYGLPIAMGVPVQISVWLINSVIAMSVFFFAKWFLNFREAQASIGTKWFPPSVILLSTCLLFLLSNFALSGNRDSVPSVNACANAVRADGTRTHSRWLLAGL